MCVRVWNSDKHSCHRQQFEVFKTLLCDCLCAFQQEIPARDPVVREGPVPPVHRDSGNTSWAGSWTVTTSRQTPSFCSRGVSQLISLVSKWKVPRSTSRDFFCKKMGHQSRGQKKLWIWRRTALLMGHFNTVVDMQPCAGVVAVECSRYQLLNTPGEKITTMYSKLNKSVLYRFWKAFMNLLMHQISRQLLAG